MYTSSAHIWAARELATASFGDRRLTQRLIRLVSDKLANPTASIPQASGDWAATKAAYRFLASPLVTPDAIRAAHRDATLSRIAAEQAVLLLQDTTELDYSSHPHTSGLGYLDHATRSGLKVHSALAATLQGVPLGLVHQQVWTRDQATKGHKKRSRPQAEKESQRWLDTLLAVEAAVEQDVQLIVVADREADIYPLFAVQRRAGVELVVRATYDRALVGEARMHQVAQQVEPQGKRQISIPGNGERAARTASVTVGWTSVQMLPSQGYPRPATAPRPRVQLVVVHEVDAPEGVKPLRWLLWTTLPVTNWDEALLVADYYRARWLIERYHYVLKSGCGVERLQLETAEGLERALAVCCIVAWRLLFLTYRARQTPELPCTEVLGEHEWQALYCTVHRTPYPPHKAPSLHEAVVLLARLGGFLARKGDGEPGVKTIWRGLTRLEDIAATWLLVRGAQDHRLDHSLMGNG